MGDNLDSYSFHAICRFQKYPSRIFIFIIIPSEFQANRPFVIVLGNSHSKIQK